MAQVIGIKKVLRVHRLPSNVRFYRMKLKLSQEALAEKANLHRTYISDIERGQRNVSLENIYNIAVALEIEPYMLLQKTDERNEV